MTKKLSVFIAALLFILVLPVSANANSAEPPGITVIVENAPQDISLTLQLTEESGQQVYVQKAQKNWEVYFRLYYHPGSGTLDDAVILVESSEKSFTCPLPEGVHNRYNNLLTLDFHAQTLTLGQRWWRQPVLTIARITLTLLVEGLIFFAFGFRSKGSWILFLAVNLITQGWLNYIINTSAFSNGYWVIGLYLAEFVIFLAETVTFPLAMKEWKIWQRILCALTANAASLIAGLFLIQYLPI